MGFWDGIGIWRLSGENESKSQKFRLGKNTSPIPHLPLISNLQTIKEQNKNLHGFWLWSCNVMVNGWMEDGMWSVEYRTGFGFGFFMSWRVGWMGLGWIFDRFFYFRYIYCERCRAGWGYFGVILLWRGYYRFAWAVWWLVGNGRMDCSRFWGAFTKAYWGFLRVCFHALLGDEERVAIFGFFTVWLWYRGFFWAGGDLLVMWLGLGC